MTFRKRQNYADNKMIGGCQWVWRKEEYGAQKIFRAGTLFDMIL